MANLGDSFRKAGLRSQKEQRQQEHDERLRRKEVGREGLVLEERKREEERRKRQEEQRLESQRIERERRAELDAAAERARIRDLLQSQALSDVRGARRFHFVDADGRIPYVMVSDEIGRRLEAGTLAIATRGRIIPRTLAEEVRAIEPESILFWNAG